VITPPVITSTSGEGALDMRERIVWRPKRAKSWWLVALAALFPIGAVVLAQWKGGPLWALILFGAIGPVGAALLDQLHWIADRGDKYWETLHRVTRNIFSTGHYERVRDVAPARFGVHPAHVVLDYVPRLAESEVLAGLNSGCPVLVVGDSMSGKTRMTAHVLVDNFGERPILIPSPPNGLKELVAELHGFVVWLDDMNRYLVGEGVRVEWLDRMLSDGNVIVATMRAKEYEKFQPTKDLRLPQAEQLERFSIVHLQADASEKHQMAEQITNPRTRHGVERYGLAEYIGGGYLAVERFKTGETQHPLGAAIVRAAADWLRVGLDTIQADTLAALALTYLPEQYRNDPAEDTATAIAWASERVDGVMRLLEPAEKGAYRAFDYILDYLSRQAAPVPKRTWQEAAASAPAGPATTFVAYRAYLAGYTDVAERLWQSTVDSHYPYLAPLAAFSLGVLRAEQGDHDAAAAAFQVAIDSHHHDLAPRAAFGLGALRAKQGDLDAAAAAYQKAIDSNHPDVAPKAAFVLGKLLLDRGYLDAAAAAFQVAIDSNHPDFAPGAKLGLNVVIMEQVDLQAAAFKAEIDSHSAESGTESDVQTRGTTREGGHEEQ
jgi:tetratricopeptide (TPR) repeat protein